MRTLTHRRALLASARVRLHRLEDRSIASPTPGSARRHRPRDRPHTRARPRPSLAAGPTVVVQPGDTLTGIARRHGVSVSRLVELNDLADPNRIFAGQRLASPAAARERPARAPTVHDSHDSRRQPRIDAVGHRRALRRERRVDRGRQPPRQPEPDLRRPAARDPRRPDAPRAPDLTRMLEVVPRRRGRAASLVHVVSRGSTLWGIAAPLRRERQLDRPRRTISPIPSRIFPGQRLVIPGAKRADQPPAAPRAKMSSRDGPPRRRADSIRRIIVREARSLRRPASAALAVAWQESGWQQGVVSHAGAVGVMQLLPATADWVGETMLGRPGARSTRHGATSPPASGSSATISTGTSGNRDLVLAAYYQGQQRSTTTASIPISRPYIASIRRLERLFGG